MRSRSTSRLVGLMVIILSLTACSGQVETAISATSTPSTQISVTSTSILSTQNIIAPLAQAILAALKTKDMNMLASYVSPTAGVRFSPYANVKQTDQVLTQAQLKTALIDAKLYTWGSYDGSGQPIQMTFADYYASFVYSQDFAGASQIGYDQAVSSGNTLDNSHDFYAHAYVVEYYLPGSDPSLGSMDWQSLRLVFQQEAGQWKLTGIIHSQWTI